MSENSTWTQDESPYIVTGNLMVEDGVTLTIEPGVEVRFDGDFYLKVQGALGALGDENRSIVFTSNKVVPSPGDWKSIEFTDSSDDGQCIMNYCEIRYAVNGVLIKDASPIISYSLITRYSFCGINAEGSQSSCSPNINNNTIQDGEFGIALTNCPAKISDNQILDNTLNGIYCSYHESTPVLINNVISNNNHGIYCEASRPRIIHNTITDNSDGILVYKGECWIWYNTIQGNGNGIHILKECEPNITYNNLLGNGDYDVRYEDKPDLYAPYNYWGTNDTMVIDSRIFDFFDDFNYGKFIYTPFLTKPSMGAPSITVPLIDGDHDGVPDEQDAFPKDPDEWIDSDFDGVGDNSDVFPDDPVEWSDNDRDGVGDNSDKFPGDPSEWEDSDCDGVGDNSDAFPFDASESRDSDGDRVGDNSDPFPFDPTEWRDSDGDGVGDNSDAFPHDRAASKDTDLDGHPDEWNGGMSEDDSDTGLTLDDYPRDPSKWQQEDESNTVVPKVAVFGVVSIVCLLVLGATEVSKAKLYAIAFPMYSWLKGEEVLDQFTRGQIYGVIRINPGINYSKIMDVLRIGNGTLAYHLSVLEKEGFIKSERKGLLRVFFPTRLPAKFKNLEKRFPTGKAVFDGIKLSKLQDDIKRLVFFTPGITQSEIVSKLKIPKQTVSYNVKHLVDYGVIEVRRNGNMAKCYPPE